MAITERYVDVSGSTTWSDSLSTSTPVTLATALTNAVAGDRLNIKAGTYTLSANTTFATSGTTTSPIIFRGVDASWAAIPVTRTGGNGAISSTLPVFALADNYYFAGSGNYVVYDSIKFTGKINNAYGVVDLHAGSNRVIHGCIVENSHTANTVVGLSLANNDTVVNSDASLTGSGYTTGCYAIHCNGYSGRILYSRVAVAGTGSGIRLGAGGSVIGCCIHDVGLTGISVAATSGNVAIFENTLANIAGAAINITTGTTGSVFVLNNRVTDCGTYGYFCADATNIHFDGYNRYDRNTTANSSGGADWTTASTWANNTTSAIDADEYTDSASNDYSLVAAAPGIGTGIFASRDMGSIQTAGTGDTIIGGGGGGGGAGSGYKGVVTKGTTSYICHVQVSDSSNGDPKTGLAYSAFSSSFMRAGASAITTSTVASISTLGTYAGTAANTAVKEVSAANAPGLYEVHIPNNALATGSNRVTLMLRDAGTNGFQPVLIELHLVDYDPQDAVRAGLTALPNAAAASASGLPITSDLSDEATQAAAFWDLANGVETGLTPRNAMKLMAAAAAGKVTITGSDPYTVTIKGAVNDTKDRVVATTDDAGNRSAITLDLT